MSCSTSTCPAQSAPAPMPMVGMRNCCVTARASAAGISSSTIMPAPASSISLASLINRSAWDSVLPCTRYPPNWCTDCGHLGLTPQSVHQLGGYRLQGKTESQAERLISEAKLIEDAGAGMIVLELIPAALARAVTQQLRIPTIGIGAGGDCAGQVLVLHDMLDIYPGKKAK